MAVVKAQTLHSERVALADLTKIRAVVPTTPSIPLVRTLLDTVQEAEDKVTTTPRTAMIPIWPAVVRQDM